MIHKNKSVRVFIAIIVGIFIVIIVILYTEENENDQSFMFYGPSDDSFSDSNTVDIKDIENIEEDLEGDNRISNYDLEKEEDFQDKENITEEKDKLREESTEEEIKNYDALKNKGPSENITEEKDKLREESTEEEIKNYDTLKNKGPSENKIKGEKCNISDRFFMQCANNQLDGLENNQFTKMVLYCNYIMYKISRNNISEIKMRRYSEENKLQVTKINNETVDRLYEIIKEVRLILFTSGLNTRNFIQDIVKTCKLYDNSKIYKLSINGMQLIIDNQDVIRKIIEENRYLLEEDIQSKICVKNLKVCCGNSISVMEYSFSVFIEFFIYMILKEQQTKQNVHRNK
ncbi:hypothetical protein P3W45_000655 [Vairimorpha bombi]|jgi:hypothetical protein